jgi:hypothetical protein
LNGGPPAINQSRLPDGSRQPSRSIQIIAA